MDETDLLFTNRLQLKYAQEASSVFTDLLFNRNERAQEEQMEVVKEAPVFQKLCIDGRVHPVLVSGFNAHIGGSI